jgi:hypothetical protein
MLLTALLILDPGFAPRLGELYIGNGFFTEYFFSGMPRYLAKKIRRHSDW